MAGLGQAEEAFRAVLTARVRVLGDDHPQTRQTRKALEGYQRPVVIVTGSGKNARPSRCSAAFS